MRTEKMGLVNVLDRWTGITFLIINEEVQST